MEDIDLLIDSNLKLICESNDQQISVDKFIDIHKKELKSHFNGSLFADKMETRRLISRKGKLCIASSLGCEIYKNGGWLIHVKDKNDKDVQLKNKQGEKEKLERDIRLLTQDNIEHQKKIRKQEDHIQNLEEKIKLISLIKSYWWFILTCVILGFLLAKI